MGLLRRRQLLLDHGESMKIYISGTYAEQKRFREYASRLFLLGHKVTGTWLHETSKPSYLSEDEWFRQLAVKDLCELSEADVIIMDEDGKSTSGGRYVEWGYALGRFDMLKFLVCEKVYGVFQQLADKHFTNWDDVIKYIEENYK